MLRHILQLVNDKDGSGGHFLLQSGKLFHYLGQSPFPEFIMQLVQKFIICLIHQCFAGCIGPCPIDLVSLRFGMTINLIEHLGLSSTLLPQENIGAPYHLAIGQLFQEMLMSSPVIENLLHLPRSIE